MAGVWPKTLNVRQTDRQRKWLPISLHCQVPWNPVQYPGGTQRFPSGWALHKIEREGTLARSFYEAWVTLIPDKNTTTTKSFRPVSLMNIDAKLSYIVNWILYEYIKITHHNQVFFNPEMQVWSNIYKSINVVNCNKETQGQEFQGHLGRHKVVPAELDYLSSISRGRSKGADPWRHM